MSPSCSVALWLYVRGSLVVRRPVTACSRLEEVAVFESLYCCCSSVVPFQHRNSSMDAGFSRRSRLDLPTQANFLTCARPATQAFPSTTNPRQSIQAGLWVRDRVRVRVGVPRRGVAAVSRVHKQSHRREKNPLQSRDKTLPH